MQQARKKPETRSTLKPIGELCELYLHEAEVRVIVLSPAMTTDRVVRPVEISMVRPTPAEDDLMAATWEDAEWQ